MLYSNKRHSDMLRFLFFIVVLTILCFSQAAFANEDEVVIQPRVVGGMNAPIINFKYQVGIAIAGFVCGGSLISHEWVVTAGHCVEGHDNTDDYLVRAGSNNFYKGGAESGVSKIIPHPQFNSNSLIYDIALLKLSTGFANAMANNKPITIIELASSLPAAGKSVTLSGFGLTRDKGQMANVLQKASIKIIAKTKCNRSYGNGLSATMFCAGLWEGGKGSCQGDSGGPLVSGGKLIGIVSFGRVCAAASFPGVYTSVPYLRSWIVDTMKAN